MAEQINFLSYTGLSQYHGLITNYVDEAVSTGIATSFKGVSLSEGKLQFWTEFPFEGVDGVSPAYEITLPKEDLSHFMELVDGAVEGNVASFGANGQVIDSGVKIADLATKAEVKEVADAINALAGKVGEVPENQTVMDIITNIQENAYDDTELRGLISDLDANKADKTAMDKVAEDLASEVQRATGEEARIENLVTAEAEAARAAEKANADAIAVLNGDETTEGSVAKDIKDAINEFATRVSDNSTFDTFKELVDYVAEHGGEAAEMASAIDALEALVGDKAVATQIAEAIAAENLAQYATDAELAEAIARIVTLETASATYATKDELTAETTARTEADAKTLTDAKAYTDAEVLKDRDRLNALEEIDHDAYVAADTALEEKLSAVIALKADQTALDAEATARENADKAINDKIGVVAEGKTVVQMITDAQTAATYDDTEVKADIAALEEESATHAKQANLEAEVTRATEKEAELVAADEALSGRLDALESVEHVEITEVEIKQLFGITE